MDFKRMVKSKFSSIAISTKADSTHRKSFSNDGFQPTAVVKKRGVYVEKKTKLSMETHEQHDIQRLRKPPRRPRPGQKKFVDSVLTILSKSTTGTQYPDTSEDINKARFKAQWQAKNNLESKTTQKTAKTKKTKYRSRILNDEMLRNEKEQLVIIQPKKDITQTPSTNSFRVRTSDFIKLPSENEPRRTVRDILENNIYSGVEEGITTEVVKRKPKREKKLRIVDEPETMASEMKKKDERNMYDFFVDLLETTINVYNVKTEYEVDDTPKSALEIDSTVVEKLEIKKNATSDNLACTYKCSRENEFEYDGFNIIENIPIDVNPSEIKPISDKRIKMKAKSFINPTKSHMNKLKSVPKSKSFACNKKCICRPNKKEIIKQFKEQLEKDTYTYYNEPENLYDALKIMAKNKRINAKSINFNEQFVNNKYVEAECMFDRRRVVSFGPRKRFKPLNNTVPSRNTKKYIENNINDRKYTSEHSLKVFGYDYEDRTTPVQLENNRKILYIYQSSPSIGESKLDCYTASMNYPDSSSDIFV